jgi:uracil-DNA glycosylase
MACCDYPRSLGELERRLRKRYEPHVRKLNQYVDALNENHQKHNKKHFVPYFDPMDGGSKATILFLLEKPGPKATAFISRNNDDTTAENAFKFMQQAGIDRKETCLWNVIPAWDEKRIKFNGGDTKNGITQLGNVIRMLPKLRVIMLVGRTAQKARRYIEAEFEDIIVCESPHPAPKAHKYHHEIPRAWKEAHKKARLNNKKAKPVLKPKKKKNSSAPVMNNQPMRTL